MNTIRFIELLGWLDNVKVAHWQADTVTNTHRALGDLYDAAAGLVDDLAELAMGKSGSREFVSQQVLVIPNVGLAELLAEGLEIVAECRTECAAGVDDDLLNNLADISATINKAKYLLKL